MDSLQLATDEFGVVRMTFDEYDAFLEKIKHVNTPTFWPSLEDLDRMEQEPGKWILFACYLDEAGQPPQNKDEEYRRKTLRKFIQKHLELYDSIEEDCH